MADILKSHQQQTVDFITSRGSCAIWLDMALGKTISTLAALLRLRPEGHMLVVAPLAIARSTWAAEIEKWGMPIRTKSLIVDEDDHQLSRDERLAAFSQIPNDPPTMYFVNRELLTRPPQSTNVLVADLAAELTTALSPWAMSTLELLVAHGPLPQDELVALVCERLTWTAKSGKAKPVAKSRAQTWIKELVKAGLAVREARPCSACAGTGCTSCRFGLIDQMPLETVDGRQRPVWPFKTVIIDEAQAFKSHSSERFQALKSVLPSIDRVIELTGTPATNGLEGLWAQMYLLDQGAALGRTITAYRERWFTPKMVPGTNTPASWEPNPGAKEEIYAAIGHLAMSAENTELVLPEVLDDDIMVHLDADVMTAYKTFKRELVIDIVSANLLDAARRDFETWLDGGSDAARTAQAELAAMNEPGRTHEIDLRVAAWAEEHRHRLAVTIVAANEAVLASKLVQFAGGTLYTTDPDDPSTKGEYEVIHPAKLDVLEYLVKDNGGSPILLAYHFRSDRIEIMKRLANAGIDAVVFDRSAKMINAWNERAYPVMLVHPASAGHGLNLQYGGHTLIWYTVPFDLEHYLQTNKRLARPGQDETVRILRLVAAGTREELQPGVLAGKKELQDELLLSVKVPSSTAAIEAEFFADIDPGDPLLAAA